MQNKKEMISFENSSFENETTFEDAEFNKYDDISEAINSFNKALQMKFTQKRVYNNLGLALCRTGRYSEALKAFREGGDEAQAYNNLGCFYLWDGKPEAAITSFEKAIGVKPSFYNKASENLRRAQTSKQNESLPESKNNSNPVN